MRCILVSLLVVILNSAPVHSADVDKHKEVYQQVTTALQSGDFTALKSYLTLQKEITFGDLKKNRKRSQKIFLKLFPPFNELRILKKLKGKGGSHYWIVEHNKVLMGSKHLKAYKFIPSGNNKLGWKLYNTRYSGSYIYPDPGNGSTRDWVVEDITKKIQSE